MPKNNFGSMGRIVCATSPDNISSPHTIEAMPELLTRAQAADYLGVTTKTLDKFNIKKLQGPGRWVRYSVPSLLEFLRECESCDIERPQLVSTQNINRDWQNRRKKSKISKPLSPKAFDLISKELGTHKA